MSTCPWRRGYPVYEEHAGLLEIGKPCAERGKHARLTVARVTSRAAVTKAISLAMSSTFAGPIVPSRDAEPTTIAAAECPQQEMHDRLLPRAGGIPFAETMIAESSVAFLSQLAISISRARS